MVALPEILAVIAALATAGAEALHARRLRRVGPLLFGPGAAPRRWTRAAGPLRALAMAALAWGLTSLYLEEPHSHKAREAAPNQQRHVILVLDVSPSMKLEDAGADGKQARSKRAGDLMRSFFQRVPMELVRLTVVATYTSAKPVVIDTRDVGVVRNIVDGLPLSHAFTSGKTDIFSGLKEAARIAQPWERNSTTILVLSDGDSVPATGMPHMPPSVSGVVVAGVGNPRTGKFINGHQSRQDAATLGQIAVRLKGTYFDGNAHELPTDMLRQITSVPEPGIFERLSRREYALICVAAGSLLLAGLPLALARMGTGWRPGFRPLASPTLKKPSTPRSAAPALPKTKTKPESNLTTKL
ncbi:MAG: von Willebrand factor type [Verrucomicrobiales bacterium]|nr:von Willebrand factor type [Verrucomicrobiales bacterium]